MSQKKSFHQRYEENDTPWEIDRVDHNLVEIVTGNHLLSGRAIDIGCGTGDNTIWLAKNGFTATGIDASPLAIERARRKAEGVDTISWYALDFGKDTIPDAHFSLAFDRGCFHTIPEGPPRTQFVETISRILVDGGLWLSLIGNADEERKGEEGPPRLNATQITSAVEPYFEILSLTTGHLDMDNNPPRCWRCLMKKRS